MERPIFTGFATLFGSGWALFYAVLGTIIGLLAGAIPGLTASAAISIIIPLSFYLDPLSALVFEVNSMMRRNELFLSFSYLFGTLIGGFACFYVGAVAVKALLADG